MSESKSSYIDGDDDDDDEYMEDKLVLTVGILRSAQKYYKLSIIIHIYYNLGDNDVGEYIPSPSKKELDLGLGLDLTRAESRY